MARCTATNRQGSQCGKSAIPGGEVCRLHGGAAPQTMAKARLRLAEQEAAKVLADLNAEDRSTKRGGPWAAMSVRSVERAAAKLNQSAAA